MRKRQDGIPLRERLADCARSLTPTPPEKAMVIAILLSILVGAAVMHYRREYRLHHPVQASPAPHRAVKSSGED